MKNLQVLTPHKKCIYNCPFCISNAHKHENRFVDNYSNDNSIWKNNLIKTIKENSDLKYVIITGTNEPMQSEECVKDIINIVRKNNKDIQIELQTHHYKENDIYDLVDVTAYSIPNFNMIKRIKPRGNIQRYVFILTDTFNNQKLEDIIKIIPKTVTQLTFKPLDDSDGYNKKIDDYVKNHSVDKNTYNKLKEEINNYKGNLSIKLDETCYNPTNRYMIFREDGNLYDSWE